MNEIVLRDVDTFAFNRAFDRCKEWAARHQAEVGVLEMALGAAILSWGVMNGQIELGKDVAASRLGDIGGMTGAGVGAVGSAAVAQVFLKGLFVGGVATVAGVTCVPALALIGGGAMVLGAFGYVIGDKLEPLLKPEAGFSDLLMEGSAVLIGAALMIDGARRIVKDERVLAAASSFKDGVIRLAPQMTEVVATSWEELQDLVRELSKSPSGMATAGVSAAAGGVIGSSLAAGSVTVLGSKGIGALALSMGLVSAPVWPIIATGAAGLALGVATWKGVTYYRNRSAKKGTKINTALLDTDERVDREE